MLLPGAVDPQLVTWLGVEQGYPADLDEAELLVGKGPSL